MVVFYSMGGLGNQLFQYATARRLAHTVGEELAVDTSWHRIRLPDTTPRAFELPRLSVRVRELSAIEGLWAVPVTNRYLRRLPLPSRWNVRRERGREVDAGVLSGVRNAFLYGYWQNPRYFQDIRPVLLEELKPADPPSDVDRRILESARGSHSVFLHVRRGDYVSLASAAQHHGACGLDYYRAAIRLVHERVRSPVFFTFSDDPRWTRENLSFEAEVVHVDHNGPAAAHQDLRLMAACRHAIIANSSFSWWGAWLGTDDPSRVVVAPRRWFASGGPVPELFPASWQPI
jgi:hypothetical protein